MFDADFAAFREAYTIRPAGTDWRGNFESAIYKGEYVETTEEVAMYFLNVVPPMLQRGNSFVVGEETDHRPNGEGIYLCFLYRNEKYQGRHCTVREFLDDLRG